MKKIICNLLLASLAGVLIARAQTGVPAPGQPVDNTNTTIAELAAMKNETTIVRAAGVVSKVKKIFTKSGQPMVFATIEDVAQTSLEVVVFNSVLEKTAPTWVENNPIIVQGRMSLRDGEIKMICDNAKVITREPPTAVA